MALKPLNSVGGFSVGETPSNIILSNGDITGTRANFTGNVTAPYFIGNVIGNILGNLSVNGPNTGVVFNDAGSANSIATFTFDKVTGIVTVTGNTVGGNFLTAGTIIASTLQSNVTTGTAPLTVASNTVVTNLNADLLDGYNTATSNTASTVAVRDASGNLSANFFIGNGSQLTGLVTDSISNGTSNVTIPAVNGNVNISSAGNANILVITGTGVNVAGTLNVTGNANAGNIGATNGVFTNISGTLTTASQTNITAVGTLGTVSVTGNANVGNIGATNGVLTGTLSVTGNANVGNLSTSGNITADYYFGNGSQLTGLVTNSISNGTSNVSIPASGGNVNTSVGGTANVLVVTTTGANIAGTLNASGNANAGNIGATTGVFTNVSGTLTTASQTNITAVGTLGSLTVTGNTTAGNFLTSGTVIASTLQSNVTTGTAPLTVASTTVVTNLNADFLDGYNTATANTGTTVAVRDASGNLDANYFIGNGSQLTGLITNSVSNGTSNVSIPASGGNVNTSVGGTADVLVVTTTGANIAGTLNASGNANVGNIGATTGVFTNISGTLTTAAQTNITSVGTLGNLTVTSNITAGNLLGVFANGTSNVVIPSAAGNINLSVGGTSNVLVVTGTGINVAGTLNSSGNANVGNLGTGGLIVATGNVTGGNLITGGIASVTGNATVGNLITGGLIEATGNVLSSASVVTDSIVGRTSGITLQATGTNQDIELRSTGTGTIDVGNTRVSNVADPSQATDAATKSYVDAAVTGIHVHDSCYVATTTTLATATGGAISYNNGPGGNTIGSYLATTGTYTTIDTGNVQTVGTRILVKDEANAAFNGIYTYTNTTAVTRSADFDTSLEAAGGDFVFITSGNINADTGWVQTTDNPTLGSSNIVWVQFSGVGSYTAGIGLTLTGTQFSITNTAVTAGTYGNGDAVSTFTVNQQGQLTAASNTFITANAANLTGTTLAATIINSSLTSVGTLGSLSVTGNANVGNIGATNGVFTNISGTLTTASQTNITSVGTLGSLSVTGNITVGNLIGIFANGTSNVIIPTAAGNINLSVGGTSNVLVVTGTGINVAGTLNASGNANVGNIGATTGVFTNVTGTLTTAAQPNITSVGTLTSVTSSGNIVGEYVTANTASFVGTTAIRWATVTTTGITANQTISTIAVTGITGVEWLIKGEDSAGSKYNVATIQAVTDGSSVDYSIYGTVSIGSATGTLVVNIVGSNIALQVTPASTNSTVWTTQYRTT